MLTLSKNLKHKILKWFSLELKISLFAIVISGYTLWDNNFKVKIDVFPGKQLDLFVGAFENNAMQPIILLNIALTNTGGRLAYIEDVKLLVDFIYENELVLRKEFGSKREIKGSIIDISEFSGLNRGTTELNPIVILGKKTELKKYLFSPNEVIYQNQIPENFDLRIKIFIKQEGKWLLKNEFAVSNNIMMWQDLDSLIHKSSIREIENIY
jgi:hypothetical protein